MRWIVLILAVANLSLFGWFYLFDETVAPKVELQLPSSSKAEARIDLARKTDSTFVPRPAVLPSGSEPLCTMLGPVDQPLQGENIVQRLQALELEARLQDIERQGQMHTWVYLPPLRSRREAYRKLRELQEAGLDSYVIPKGSFAKGISFGIFSEHERAEALAKRLYERGISVKLHRKPQLYTERWVVLPADGHDYLAADFWQKLQREFPWVHRRQEPCQQLQSPEII
ncbi:MAG: hypothetical protein K0U59_08195 [Gammaproteobacteria bacterium]|nr:hypothetical protein [Gammaproteobacteria bacterium]